MRNQFSDMVKKGVARFEYAPNESETPTLDEMVRTYNIWWGLPTGTHMSKITVDEMTEVVDPETGDVSQKQGPVTKYIITGSMFEREEVYFGRMLWDGWIRGSYAKKSGYDNLYTFFQENGYDYKKITYNNSPALELVPKESASYKNAFGGSDACCPCCTGYLRDCEMKVPMSTRALENTPGAFQRIKNESTCLEDLAKRLSESEEVKGNYNIFGGNLYCELADPTKSSSLFSEKTILRIV